jgi:hypothetical protein
MLLGVAVSIFLIGHFIRLFELSMTTPHKKRIVSESEHSCCGLNVPSRLMTQGQQRSMVGHPLLMSIICMSFSYIFKPKTDIISYYCALRAHIDLYSLQQRLSKIILYSLR